MAVLDDKIYAVGGFNGKKFLNSVEFLDLQKKEPWRSKKGKEAGYQQNGAVNGDVIKVAENGSMKSDDVITNGGGDAMNGTHDHQGTKLRQAMPGTEGLCEADLKSDIKVNGERNS